MVTKNGSIKKTNLEAYSHPRTTGIQAIKLRDKDELIGCKITGGKNEIFLATKLGKAIRFDEKQAREMGRTASGVRGIRLGKKDEVVAVEIVSEKDTALTVTSKGFGKKTLYKEYRLQSRGGKGVINIKVTEKNGHIVNVLTIREEDEIILATASGMVVRCPSEQIRICGRNTQGVRLIKLKDRDNVASATRVVSKDEDDVPEEKSEKKSSSSKS